MQTGSQGGGGASQGGASLGGGSGSGGSGAGLGGSSPSFGGSTSGGNAGSFSGGTGGVSQGGTGGTGGQGGNQPPLSVDAGFPPGTVLLEDDFENFVASAWTTSGGTWNAAGGVYSQTDNTSNDPFLAAQDGSFTDFIAQVDLNVTAFNGGSSSYMAGLCVRVADAGNFYMVGIRSNNGFPLQLRRFGGANEGILTDSNVDLNVGTWYSLRVDVIGTTITAYIDGQLMFTHSDSELTQGGVALCNSRSSVQYDNFVVTDPS